MANETTDKELLALEHQYWQAIKDGDAALSARLSDDPCVVTGSQGVGRIDRATLEGMFASAAWKLTGFEITSPIVELLTDDVAVVAYRAHEDLLVDGQPLALDARRTRRRGSGGTGNGSAPFTLRPSPVIHSDETADDSLCHDLPDDLSTRRVVLTVRGSLMLDRSP